jgi:hypothetical protein
VTIRRILTYDEVLLALREADHLGDCVPKNIEDNAIRVYNSQFKPTTHVIVYDAEGRVIDPSCQVVPLSPTALAMLRAGIESALRIRL